LRNAEEQRLKEKKDITRKKHGWRTKKDRRLLEVILFLVGNRSGKQ